MSKLSRKINAREARELVEFLNYGIPVEVKFEWSHRVTRSNAMTVGHLYGYYRYATIHVNRRWWHQANDTHRVMALFHEVGHIRTKYRKSAAQREAYAQRWAIQRACMLGRQRIARELWLDMEAWSTSKKHRKAYRCAEQQGIIRWCRRRFA